MYVAKAIIEYCKNAFATFLHHFTLIFMDVMWRNINQALLKTNTLYFLQVTFIIAFGSVHAHIEPLPTN